MFRKIGLMVVMVLVVAFFVQAVNVSSAAAAAFDTVGAKLTTTLEEAATGNIGKGLFYLSIFAGAISILFTKHRAFGIVAIIFGILIGGYKSIVSGLWTIFNTQ